MKKITNWRNATVADVEADNLLDEAARHLGINATSAKRYFLRCIRSKLKSSDL